MLAALVRSNSVTLVEFIVKTYRQELPFLLDTYNKGSCKQDK